MALKIYAQFTGETQSEIKGGSTRKGSEDHHAVSAFHHQVASAYDANSGAQTAKRTHKAARVLMDINKGTPLLFSAMVQNENLTDVVFRWWRPQKTGVEEQFYTCSMTNARIMSIRQWLPDVNDPAQIALQPQAEIELVFEKIIFTYEDGGQEGEDDWNVSTA